MHILRTPLIVALAWFALSACQQGSDQDEGSAPLTETDRDVIRSGVAGLDKAMLARDWSTAASTYAEDGIALPPNAPAAQGRSAVQRLFSGFPKVTAFKQNVVEINGHGDLAYVRGVYEAELIPPGSQAPLKDKGKVLAIWRKQKDGSWLVARAIWNSDGPASGPGLTVRPDSSK
jgi:ketosteroid isomerase-like protein